MRRLVALSIAVIAAAAGTLLILPMLVSGDFVRTGLSAELGALTGYEVEARGPVRLKAFPTPRVQMTDLALIARDGSVPVEVAELTATIGLVPLLFGSIEATGLTFARPRIALVVEGDGSRNWMPRSDGSALAALGAADAPAAAPDPNLSIGAIRVVDAEFSYRDRRDNVDLAASSVNLVLSWPRLGGAAALEGSYVWNGETVEIDLDIAQPIDFFAGRFSRTTLALSSPVARATVEGRAAYSDKLQMEGALDLRSQALDTLLVWLGVMADETRGFDALALTGTLRLVGADAALSDMRATLDGNAANGGLRLSMTADGAAIDGTLALEALDLDPYLTGGGGGARLQAPFLDNPLPSLGELDGIVVDLRISAGTLKAGPVRLGRTAASVAIRDRKIIAGIGEAEIAGGRTTGSVSVTPDASGQPRFEASMMLEEVDLARLFGAGDQTIGLTGIGGATLTVNGVGETYRGIAASLNGQARFDARDGTLQGIDVQRLVRALESQTIDRDLIGAGSRTAYRTAGAGFEIAQGRAVTRDATMQGEAYEVRAAAVIDIADETIRGRGEIALLGTNADGQPTPPLPFRVFGPVDRPLLLPEIGGLLDRAVTAGDADLGDAVNRALRELNIAPPQPPAQNQ